MSSSQNRTLVLTTEEINELSTQAITLKEDQNEKDLENKIIHQDLFHCTNFLPDSFIDLLICDPPYNLTKQFGNNSFQKMPSKDYENWFDSWASRIKRCLKETASLYVCCDWKSSKEIQQVLERYFKIQNRITWERDKGRGSLRNWKNNSEDIWFCTMSDNYYFNVDAVKLKKKVISPYRDEKGEAKDWEDTVDGKYRLTAPSNLWSDITIPFWSMPENTNHPTQKPEKLVAKLILASSKEDDFVFDPFIGSGTTCVVAKKLNRRFCGVEREIDYVGLSLKRLQLAETNNKIQGYVDGFFWERNSQPKS